MTMTPSTRKFMLTTHVTVSVGWAGALAVFLAHALASLMSQDVQMVRAASLAMGFNAWFVILPLSLTSFATGIVQALGTAWGLFRHYWIVFKLLLTAVATIVLLLKLGPISDLADVAAEMTFSSTDLVGLRTSLMVHAVGGLLVLLTATALGIYKPSGMTRYGIHKHRERRNARVDSDLELVRSMPRWVKGFGFLSIILILLVVIMMIVGGHGPGAHAP